MPYVTNEDRIRLGLQSWGSDVPAEVLAAAEAALAAPVGAVDAAPAEDAPPEPPEAPAAPSRRARTRRGQFQADDPATAVNEAFEAS